MAESERNECIEVVIPQDAVQIKVTNIINPYFMRIYEVPENRSQKSNLCRKLQRVMKSELKRSLNKKYSPIIGDDVIVSTNHMNNEKVDLPDWICRGVISDTTTKTTDVFLLDYGIAVNVPTESLIKYSRCSVPVEPLTVTVGIYNILPIDSNICIIKEWPRSTVNFMKDLIQASKTVYFEVLACDRKTNKKYGDLFLVIEDKNICLSKVLIHSFLAVPLYDELLQALKTGDITNETLIQHHLRRPKAMMNGNGPVRSIKDDVSLNEKRSMKLKKKHMNEKMLIRSKFTCQPLEHVEDSRFTTFIHKALNHQGLRLLKHIQKYMWPAIKQGLDVVAISSKASGKTVGYAVPILNCIAAKEEIILQNQQQNTVTKPLALILCASITKCIDVTTKCKEILYFHKNIKSFAAFNGLTEKNLITNIYNKFHILVTTPPFLLRLLEKYSNKLNFSELSYLVINQADTLMTKYLSEMITLIKKYKIIDKNNKNTIQGGPMQIITVANTWTDDIHKFVDVFMKEPYICIGSFVEAAAFCRVQGRMLIRHSDQKKHEVLGILGDYLKVKTMIFCLNSEEAKELNDFLVSNSVRTLLAHEHMQVTKIHEIKEDWTRYISGMYPVVICTDQVLSELEISDIVFLIHYTVTDTSKSQFNRRFSVLMDNWLLELKNKCRVLILLDETKENMHFKGVVNILQRLKVELPEDWSEMADGFDLANNIKKKNYPFCNSIKSFGVCEENSCAYRHRVIAEVDIPMTDISIGDELKLHVTYIHSASHFSARVLERIKECRVTKHKTSVPYPYEILQLNMKMKQYYSESKHRRMQNNICPGQICASRNSENIFSRVQILNIEERDIRTDKPKIVRLRSIDDGRLFDRVYVHELYEIPEELLQYKFPIIDIFLTGVAPFDEEYKWTDIANQEANNWFKKNCSASSFVFAKVLLHVGHSVWTDSLVVRSKLSGYPDLVSSSLKDILKKHEHGTENKKHLANLLHLCLSGGLTEINGHPIELITSEDEKDASIDECD